MIYELPVNIGKSTAKIFLQDNFNTASSVHSPIHNHFQCEVHIVYSGKVQLKIEKEVYNLSCGDVVAVPAKYYHWRKALSEDAKCFSFSTDYELDKPLIGKLDKNLLKSFEKDIKSFSVTDSVSKLSAYISLFWCNIFDIDFPSAIPTEDYSFLINKFFEENYHKNITLDDLAKAIKLSPKQTSRLVVKYMGNNFRTEIAKRRAVSAKLLIDTTNLSKEEIAESLGYSSYSSLWKTIKTFPD